MLGERLMEDSYRKTLHVGVGLMVINIRENDWISKFHQKTKKVINGCYGCKIYRAVALPVPQIGILPRDRTQGSCPFQIVEVDFAGPYRKNNKYESMTYITLFSCNFKLAMYLKLLSDQTLEELIKYIKGFMPRKGRPEKIYSNNVKIFVAASKGLKNFMKEERFH